MDLHECDEAMDLGFLRHQFGENTAESQRLIADGVEFSMRSGI